MAPNVIIYCLEDVTDYFEFERLSHDLMALDGFRSIEPLGGFKDKGRDAVHINVSGETTIFAYSVREDWRAKLAEDAAKIHKHGHTCDQLFFITTARFTAGERDEAVNSIRDEFEWHLELFGVERLRILLEVEHPQVISNHPGIFPPRFFPQEIKPIAAIERKHIFVSFAPEDSALAEWLSRRLTVEGYDVWCERFKTLSNEPYPNDPDEAIKNSAESLLKGILKTYEELGGKQLTEIFLHSRSTINNEEFEGYQKACPSGVKLVGVRVRVERYGPRLFRTETMPILRGTFWKINDRAGLLWGSGFKPRIATYDGAEIPIPMRIDVQHGNAPIERVAQDIFGLTKLNYNACHLGDGEPVTVGFSDAVGEILISNPKISERKPNFKFYI